MSAEQYWTGWLLAVVYLLAVLMLSYSVAEIWAWLDEKERQGR